MGPSPDIKTSQARTWRCVLVRYGFLLDLVTHWSVVYQIIVADSGLCFQKELENVLLKLKLDPEKFAPYFVKLGVESIEVCNQ